MTIEETVQNETAAAQEAAEEKLNYAVDKAWRVLSHLPLHTHMSAMKILDARTEHRGVTMQLEAQQKMQEQQAKFEAERAADHARLQAAKPKLVTN